MKIDDIFYWIERHRSRIRFFLTPALLLMIAGVYAFVLLTGGIKYVFSHSMYLPIALSAIAFGVKGGVAAALLGGLLLGPFTPIDTITGEPQATINWLYRVGFFTLIGFIVGITSDMVITYLNRMQWDATHDGTTGLPNTLALSNALKNLSNLEDNKTKSYFLFVALLDNHTDIETTFGAHCVNVIITQLAASICNELKDCTNIYRVGSDRLGFVLREEQEHNIKHLTSKLNQVFTVPLKFGDIQLHADIYLGIVALDREGISKAPDLYIQRASHSATESSKGRARDIILSKIAEDAQISENLELLGELGQALTNKQICLHYQPKVVTTTGVIDSVEALMRWTHPVRGNIPPVKFIPYAEKSTLIDQITYFAIDQALTQLAAWEKSGMFNMRVAVNISTRNLLYPDFVKTVIQLLELHNVKGEKLELEITESSFLEDMEGSIVKLLTLTNAGLILSLDDFGTGYSSLQYLEKIPVTLIKIDQGFVGALPAESGSRQIVEAAIGLAHNLGMKVVAEGVETRAAYDFLLSAGCDLIQGYFVSHPIPAEELEKMCAASKGHLVNVKNA